MEQYPEEKVYVVRPDTFSDFENGFTYQPDFNYKRYEQNGKFILRKEVENNPAVQQIIPYVIVRCGSRYLTYKRLETSGEPRLHHTYSLGIGGHINTDDGMENPIQNGMLRELDEELFYTTVKPIQCIGLIRDIESSTNDHTGIVFLMDVLDAQIRETYELEERWMTKPQLKTNFLDFESWGKYLIDHMIYQNKF